MHQLQRSWVRPSIRRHSGIWGAPEEAVLNIVRKKNPPKNILKLIFWIALICLLNSIPGLESGRGSIDQNKSRSNRILKKNWHWITFNRLSLLSVQNIWRRFCLWFLCPLPLWPNEGERGGLHALYKSILIDVHIRKTRGQNSFSIYKTTTKDHLINAMLLTRYKLTDSEPEFVNVQRALST